MSKFSAVIFSFFLFITTTILSTIWLGTAPARAGDTALLLVNRYYDNGDNVTNAFRALSLRQTLPEFGFRVETEEQSDLQDTFAGVRRFERAHDGDGRVVIVAAGRFVALAGNLWWLAREADDPNALTVGSVALPVSHLLDLAAQAPGQAVVMLGTADQNVSDARGLRRALNELDIPQGVTLITGSMRKLPQVLTERVLDPGTGLDEALADVPGIAVRGFVSGAAFNPESPGPARGDGTEYGFWQAVRAIATPEAYRAYLNAYPDGRYSADAREILNPTPPPDPAASPKDVEAALGLTRDQRRALQQDLTVLGFDTHGADGIFGRRSRTAIKGWQRGEGLSGTGYLTGNQANRLHRAGNVRRREIADEEQRRRAQAEARERTYWAQVTDSGDAQSLTTYLDRYPNGLYAAEARRRLAAIEDQRRERAEARDRAYWAQTNHGRDEAGLRAYLEHFPDGLYADTARQRLAAIEDRDRGRAEARDRAYWSNVGDGGGEAGLRAYLDRYPNGVYSDTARRRLARIEDRRHDRSRAEAQDRAYWAAQNEGRDEAGLRAYLDRYPSGVYADIALRRLARIDARRRDRDNAAAADRAFWAAQNEGRTEAGLRAYINRYPNGIYAEIARQRLAQIADDAEARRRAEADAADRAFWAAQNEGRAEAGLRAYLGRYPSGVYSDIARQRLARIEAERRARRDAEQQSWRNARSADTIAAFEAYLAQYPDGPNAAVARARIEELRRGVGPDPAIEQARREEQAFLRSPGSGLLAEQRLQFRGLNPGPVDGTIDAATRAAIRQFQTSIGINATGYLDSTTSVTLTAPKPEPHY